jgi:hypothetical protein
MSEHWLDTLGKRVARQSPRRDVLRLAARLTPGLFLAAAPTASSARKQGAKKQPKEQPKQSKRCGRAPCAGAFATKDDRDFCEVKCGRCKKAGTNFCIIEGDPRDPAKIATCCHRGDECCGHECCGEVIAGDETLRRRCCDARLSLCCPRSWECCPDDERGGEGVGCCETAAGWRCCPRVGCVHTDSDTSHCGRCGNACASGQTCVVGACVPTTACPPRSTPCGGPNVREPDECCDDAGCEACVGGDAGQVQCVYQCAADQVCLDDVGGGFPARCCWTTGHACSAGNPASAATCCSLECELDETTERSRCA